MHAAFGARLVRGTLKHVAGGLGGRVLFFGGIARLDVVKALFSLPPSGTLLNSFRQSIAVHRERLLSLSADAPFRGRLTDDSSDKVVPLSISLPAQQRDTNREVRIAATYSGMIRFMNSSNNGTVKAVSP